MFYTVGIKATFKYFPLTWREEDQISNLDMVKHLKEWLVVIKDYCFNFNFFMNEYHCPIQNFEYKTIYSDKLVEK